MPRESVLATQESLLELSREIRDAESKLERMKARLEQLTQPHKEQKRMARVGNALLKDAAERLFQRIENPPAPAPK